MQDYFELDFLSVDSDKSGDAIAIRYSLNGVTRIHVVDGGFQDTGDELVSHIDEHYGSPNVIDAVVLTHPDGDHAGGLQKVLERFDVGALWMLRPWLYADELLPRFSGYKSRESLVKRLKEAYPNVAKLEEIASAKGIGIFAPFQGTTIGDFLVLAPTRDRYLELVVESEKTPTTAFAQKTAVVSFFRKIVSYVRAMWGVEAFSAEETSTENEMSVVQYAILLGQKILLTGDVGRGGLREAAAYAPFIGLNLPGIDRFQVPHHGSRRNVNTEILDMWLGKRLPNPVFEGKQRFRAIISASEKDKDHPRKAVVRAMHHRGGSVITTESGNICSRMNAPDRKTWGPAEPVPYPDEQEDD